MSRQLLQKAVPEPEKDYEDEYRRLQSHFNDVKKERAVQDDQIKKLTTKIRKLESDFNQLSGNPSVGSGAGQQQQLQYKPTKEDERLIESLLSDNRKLKNQNAAIIEKNNQLIEQLKKKDRELVIAKKVAAQYKAKSISVSKENNPASSSSSSSKVYQEVDIKPAPTSMLTNQHTNSNVAAVSVAASSSSNVNNDSNLLELARSYKARLAVAEGQIKQLRDELVTRGSATSASISKGTSGGDSDAQLRDANWKLQQLQTQYDYLVSKTSMQGQAYKSSEDQVEEYAHKVRDLRRALEELKHEKDLTDARATRAEELDDMVRELRVTNRSLEDKIARLCDYWGGDITALQHDSRSMRNDDTSNREREELLTKVNLLQDSIRTKHAALESLRQQAEKLRLDKEEAVRKAEDMKGKLEEVNSNTALLQNKLRLFSGDDGIDLETLEHALTLVKRKTQAMEKLSFLEDPNGDGMMTLPIVKRRLEEVQVMNLKLTEEVERMESMLKLQSGINKDLHAELEALIMKRDKDKRDIAQQAGDFEELAIRRLDTIHRLEAQIKELTYTMTSKKGSNAMYSKGKAAAAAAGGNDNIFDVSTNMSDVDNVLLSELIDEKGDDAVLPFENLLEVWIKGATLRDGIVTPGASTFVVVDFFDYESQATSLQYGSKPMWDFASTFKINVDDFLLRYLATDVITLEMNMACQGDYTLLARCTLPLSSLLKAKPCIKLKQHPMISVSTGDILAHITVDIKLALPVSELYRLFLERHPHERKQIEELATKRTLQTISAIDKAKTVESLRLNMNEEDESRLYNEIDVIIVKAVDLPVGIDGKPPHAYVYFQLLGHPDKYTNPQPNSNSPTFNEQFTFPFITNDQQLRLLQRSKLELTVMDMKGEEDNNDSNEGLIGDVFVSLAELADGHKVTDTFSIKNTSTGKKVGELQLSIKWKYPFKRVRELGPRALSGVEVETLMSSFGDNDINAGIIDYKAFCRFIDPPIDVRTPIDRVRTYCRSVSYKENRSARSIFGMFNDMNVSDDVFLERMLLLQIDLSPAEVRSLFAFIDMDDDGYISLDQILAVLNLDEDVGIPAYLHEKLRERSRDLETRGVTPLTLFRDADQWGPNGLVTRMEFKGVLKKMGFQLVDDVEPASVSSIMRHGPDGNRGSDDVNISGIDSMNDTRGSTDEVLGNDDNDRAYTTANATVNQQNRELFEERKNDLLKRSQQALHVQQLKASYDKSPVVSQSNETLADDPYGVEQHRSSIARSGVIVGTASTTTAAASMDGGNTGALTLIKPHDFESGPATGIAIINEMPSSMTQVTTIEGDILTAEQTIHSCLAALKGVKSLPNLLGGFQTVDTKRTGYVSRKQFAHVMMQFTSIKLSPSELRACMDCFDKSSNGTEIDYTAFVKMCRYKKPDLLASFDKMDKLMLSSTAILKFRAQDTVGTGFLRRADMLRVLGELGYGQISNTVMLQVLEIFETRVDGHVNYNNFVEYIRENDISKALDHASSMLYNLLRDDMMSYFKSIDRDGNGRINVNQFVTFLDQRNICKSLEISTALYLNIEKDGRGIHTSDLKQWIKAYPDQFKLVGLYGTLSVAELQCKISKYLVAVAASGSSKLREVAMSYNIYDWHQPPRGMIAESLFVHATKRAGFPLTMTEIRLLSSEFAVVDKVSGKAIKYKKFLHWSTPSSTSDDGIIKDSLNELNAAPGGGFEVRRTASGILKHLEKSIAIGDDLLSIFGRYDTISVGRITADDFSSALSEIGLSNAPIKEVLAVADRLKAVVGDFILYRKLFSELLKAIDDASGSADIDIIDVIKSCMVRNRVDLIRLRDVFEYYDRKNVGKVREEDVGTIFDEAGITLKRQEIQTVSDKYSISTGSGSGYIQYIPLLNAIEIRTGEKQLSLLKASTTASSVGISEDLKVKMRELFDALIIKGRDYRCEFDKFDSSLTGSISVADFREVMQDRLRCGLSSRELDMLERTYKHINDSRRINHIKMIHEVHPHSLDTNSGDSGSMYEIAEELRLKIRRRCDYMTVGELRRPYKHFTRRKGETYVSIDDLSEAVSNLGIRLAGDQVQHLFDLINIGNGKAFNYCDFKVFVCDPNYHDVIWKLRRLMQRSKVSDREIVNTMNDVDSNSSGLLTASQFAKAMKSCSIELSDSDVARLMIRFDVEETQRFDIETFSRFLRGHAYSSTATSTGAITSGGVGVGNDVETQAWNSLRRRIESKIDVGYTKNEVFAMFDTGNSGTLDIMSIQQGAREIGATISRTEARSILRRISLLAGGAADRDAFIHAFIATKTDIHTNSSSSGTDSDGNDLLSTIRKYVDIATDRSDSSSSSPSELLRKSLMKYATGSRDSISSDDFVRCLDQLRVKMSTKDMHRTYHAIAVTAGVTTLDVGTIIDSVITRRGSSSSSSSSSRSSSVTASVYRRRPDILDVFMHEVHKMSSSGSGSGSSSSSVDTTRLMQDLLNSFKRSDARDAGTIERVEFTRILSRFGFNLSDAQLRDIADTLCETSNAIDYTDFVAATTAEYSKYIGSSSSSTGDTAAFELLCKRLSRDIRYNDHGQLEDKLKRLDRQLTMHIDVDDFEVTLEKFGVSLTKAEAKLLYSRYGCQSNRIKYMDFMAALRDW